MRTLMRMVLTERERHTQMTRQQEVMVAAAAFVTTYDESSKKEPGFIGVPESYFYLTLGGQTKDLDTIRILIQINVCRREPGHVLVIGETGKQILASIRRAQAEGKFPKDI